MSPRTLSLQNQIRSTVSGVEYQDDLTLALAESLVNEAFLTDETQVSGTLIMDLNFLRTAVRDIKGSSPAFNWFDPSSTTSTATLIDLNEARTAITNLQNFTGSSGDSDTTPDYTSLCFIAQNDPLETAISTLDQQLCITTGTIVIDHGDLDGLGDDDHEQYILTDGTRPTQEPGHLFSDGVGTLTWSGAAHVSSTEPSSHLGRVWLDMADVAPSSSGVIFRITTEVSSVPLTDENDVILCDAAGGDMVVTLPPAGTNLGRSYYIKKIDSSTNVVTASGNVISEVIDGDINFDLTSKDESIRVVCDGSNWFIL